MQISEREGELFTLGDASDAEVEPSFVVVDIFNMRFTVLSYPQIKLIFVGSSIGTRQVT